MNKKDLNEDNIFKIFEDYCKNKGLIQHQIDSYNYFINDYLQRIFNELPEIVLNPKKNERYTVSFGQVYVDYPTYFDENRNSKPLFPVDARLRDLNYESNISVDIREILEDTDKNKIIFENYHPKTFITKIPIMINSCRCNLEKMTIDEKINAGECENDPGGYFIIKGKERVLICQERINYNHVYVFEQKSGSKYPYVAEIRSMSDETGHSVLVQAKFSEELNNIIFSIPYIKDEIPVKILLRSLNFSDQEIRSLIGCDGLTEEIDEFIDSIIRSNPEIKYYKINDQITASKVNVCYTDSKGLEKTELLNTKDAIEKAKEINLDLLEINGKLNPPLCKFGRNRDAAIKYISKNPTNVTADDKKESYAEQTVDNELFPHLGHSTEKERGMLIGHMCNILIKTYYKIRTEDDRDNLSLKRVEAAGTLIGDLFRMLLKRLLDQGKKFLEKRQDILNFLTKNNTINNGLRHSFATGNWGVQKNNYIRTGVCQVLSRLTYSATISHLRRVVIPIGKEGKNTKIRQLHPTQIFFIDPAESPEGQTIGIVKNLAMMAKLSTSTMSTIELREIVEKIDSIFKINSVELKKFDTTSTKIFINGIIIGFCNKNEARNILEKLRDYRKIGLINHEISISYDEFDNEIKILGDDGRLIRPVFVVKDRKLLINIDDVNMGWDYLIDNGLIQYVDNNEVENSLIAMYPKDLLEYSEHSYDYCEIHPCVMLGVCAGVIPFSSHSQSPRNCYQTSMMKQALGLFATNYKDRVDTVTHVLHYPQKPMVSTKFNKMLKYDDMPNGINCIVAIACYTGQNQEDSLILNKSSVDRGLFVSSCFKTLTCEEKKRTTNAYETVEVPPLNVRIKKYNYNKLGKDGIVPKGTHVYKDDVLIGRTLTKSYKDNEEEKSDCSLVVTNGYEGVVDLIYQGVNSEGYKIIKIKIRSLRIPEVGDKLASRAAQKGTIGMVLPQEDMPFTSDGIVPDIIMNSMALPSRMTINQLLECLMGKKCALKGDYEDATPFTDSDRDPVERITNQLKEFGYEKYGNEMMYNGFTGEPLKAKIFIGPTFYQRLKHLVADKIHCLTLDHEVLTEDGWKTYFQLSKDDKVAVLKEVNKKYFYEYEKPEEILYYPNYNGRLYHIKNDKIDLSVTENHKMWMKISGEDKYQLIQAREIEGIKAYYHNMNEKIMVNKNKKEDYFTEYTGPVFCLTVSSGIFYVRKNEKEIWTGNSRAYGSVTMFSRQPAEGRSREGGLRLGEIKNCLKQVAANKGAKSPYWINSVNFVVIY